MTDFSSARVSDLRPAIYWRVEGSLLNLSAVRPVAYFTWNAQTFSERWKRRGGLFLLALVRPLLYAIDRIFATRVLHTLLRGISRDRLDLLGEEYFEYVLEPQLRSSSVQMLTTLISKGENVVLVSQGLDHVMRPLARHLGVNRLIANRLEFRDGLATGRLEGPVIRPRQFLARIIGRKIDGRISARETDSPARICSSRGNPRNCSHPGSRNFSRQTRPARSLRQFYTASTTFPFAGHSREGRYF